MLTLTPLNATISFGLNGELTAFSFQNTTVACKFIKLVKNYKLQQFVYFVVHLL